MTEATLVACQPRPFQVTTTPGDGQGAGDLCRRDSPPQAGGAPTATAPATQLVGDITHIHTWEGFAHQATAIDCCSKTVIGWSVAAHVRTSLVTDALAESFCATLKNEPVHRTTFPTIKHATTAVARHIEIFHNRQRRRGEAETGAALIWNEPEHPCARSGCWQWRSP